MFYKLVNGNVVIDVLSNIHYLRYLPNAKRWMNTDGLSANGVLGSNGNTIYHLIGRACTCPNETARVRVEEINELEYNMLLEQLSNSHAENQKLKQEINELRAQLESQSLLLQQILAKL